MPIANIRGVDINYEILGDRGPFVALQPGGRRAGASLRPLATRIAEAGNRVVIYDRRNCGASGIAISGTAENDEWTEARRYMGPEILAACRNAAAAAPGPGTGEAVSLGA